MRPFSTFRQKITLGFSATVAAAILIAIMSLYALRLVTQTLSIVNFEYTQELLEAAALQVLSEQVVSSGRGYILTNSNQFLDKMQASRNTFQQKLDNLHRIVRSPEGKVLTKEIERYSSEYLSSFHQFLRSRAVGSRRPSLLVIQTFETNLQPRRERLENAISAFVEHKKRLLSSAQSAATRSAHRAQLFVQIMAVTAILLSIALSILIVRTVTRLYAEAQSAILARDNILAIVSHDLRNPLTAIQLNLNLLSSSLEPRPEEGRIDKLLRLMEETAIRMQRLISDLLDLSRLEANAVHLDLRSLRPERLVEQTLTILEPLAQHKALNIRKEYCDQGTVVLCDGERIIQVLSNLIGNAIKFTPQGGTITIRTERLEHSIRFSVSDTGRGIPEEHLHTIFERYQQARIKDARQGAGLGLFIAKKIVEAHGGTIQAENSSSGGARFSFQLPISIPVI